MSYVDEVAVKRLRELAEQAERGEVHVHISSRTGCGATGCEGLDWTVYVHHQHRPEQAAAGETS